MALLFLWRFLDGAGAEIGRSPSFPGAVDAEAWLSVSWESLHDRGVEEVELIDAAAGTPVYRMGLSES